MVRFREVALMSATARWMYTSGLERKETRGMHRREDFPAIDQRQRYRILSGGLDHTWAKPLVDQNSKSSIMEGTVT